MTVEKLIIIPPPLWTGKKPVLAAKFSDAI